MSYRCSWKLLSVYVSTCWSYCTKKALQKITMGIRTKNIPWCPRDTGWATGGFWRHQPLPSLRPGPIPAKGACGDALPSCPHGAFFELHQGTVSVNSAQWWCLSLFSPVSSFLPAESWMQELCIINSYFYWKNYFQLRAELARQRASAGPERALGVKESIQWERVIGFADMRY